jgi:prepilin signal peptidase PulO-like enzyme (type II secretory pathway)
VPTIAVLPSKGLRARKMHLALGPFLALGGMVALLAGDEIIAWYTGD